MSTTTQFPNIPDITLTAAGSDRQIALARIGIPTVLIFHDQSTAGDVPQINEAVRNAYPLASSVVIASVVDLHTVPKLFRAIAKREMKKSYAAAAAQLPTPMDPADYILILPDWDGTVHKALDISDTGKSAAIAVLDGNGQVVGVSQDGNLPESALTLLKQTD